MLIIISTSDLEFSDQAMSIKIFCTIYFLYFRQFCLLPSGKEDGAPKQRQ